MTGLGEAWLFWVLAPLMVLAGLGLLFVRKAVHVALCMVFLMVGLGVLYIAQQAEFLGVVQVFVYTGAVMMLFLFVLMLIGVDASDSVVETIRGQRAAGLIVALGLAGLVFFAVGSVAFPVFAGLDAVNRDPGNITGLAWLIFGQYVWVFEITSALLITAALGAMVMAHRQRLTPKATQRDLAQQRVRNNEDVAGLPAPGVYARHNAVDTPALLPDGTPSELSVSRVLVSRDQVASLERHGEVKDAVEREIEEGRAR